MAERVGLTRAILGPRPPGGYTVRIGNPADVSNPRFSSHSMMSSQYEKRPSRGALDLAERVGFEPTVGLHLRQFSRLLP